MNTKSRLKDLERRSGADADEPPRTFIVRLPEVLTEEKWTRAARAHGQAY